MVIGTKRFVSIAAVGLSIFAASCAKKKGNSANIKVEFGNDTALAFKVDDATEEATNYIVSPSYFGIKFTYAALREDQTESLSPVGMEALIYANSGCPNSENKKEINDKEYKYRSPGTCTDDLEYLDIARETSEVNADLNSQQFPVPPGTYRYVSICFEPDWKVSVDDYLAEKTEFLGDEDSQGGCTNTQIEDLAVAEGESVVISLNYDLLDSVVTAPPVEAVMDGGLCEQSDNEDYQICVNGINPTASASK